MSSIPFITYSPSLGFQLTPQTESFLSSISQTPIAVLSIVGNYRTGKSFFINRVLLNKTNGKGFTVGPSINPCTKGLWLWNEPLHHQNPDISNDIKVLLIDTEGFGGIDQNLSHNSRIGLFSLLLSSFFIYNSLGIIDENSLNSLSLIVSLGQEIMKQGESSGIFPSFLWVLRDFALQMINTEGENISNKEYLEKALEHHNKMNETKNKTRKIIRDIFAERDCLTMVRPVANEKDLQKMDALDETHFRPEFIEQITKARTMIFSKIKPKKINGKILTAGLLLELCKKFITVINGEKIPDIKSTWVYLCKSQMTSNLSACMAFVEIEYDKFKTLEIGREEIKKHGERVKNEVKDRLRKNLMGLCEKHELKEVLHKMKDFLKTQNKELKALMNEKVQKKASLFLEEKLRVFKNLDFNQSDCLKEYNSLQEYFINNKLMDPEILNFHQKLLKTCLDNYQYEINNLKKNMNRLSEQKILMLEQELQNKKKQFSVEKEALEKKSFEMENQLQILKKKNISTKKSSQCQTNESMNSIKEAESMKKEYEKKNSLLIQEKNGIVEKMNEIIFEKTKALEQISFLEKEISDLKTINTNLLNNSNYYSNSRKSFNDSNASSVPKNSNKKENYYYKSYNDQEGELIQITNRALTMTLEKTEEQTKGLKEKIFKLKEYKQTFKNTLQFQCKSCQRFVAKNFYLDHCKKGLCSKEKEMVNIYSSLNELPPHENKSLNISNIHTPQTNSKSNDPESQLICEEILSPLQENNKHLQKNELMFQKKKEKKDNLEDLIERLNKNDKYSVLHAKRLEMQSPKIPTINQENSYKSTLKKEQKKMTIFAENSNGNNKKGDRLLTLPQNLWENSENENPCSQRYDSMNFLFKSMRNCDILAKKFEENQKMYKNNNKSGI